LIQQFTHLPDQGDTLYPRNINPAWIITLNSGYGKQLSYCGHGYPINIAVYFRNIDVIEENAIFDIATTTLYFHGVTYVALNYSLALSGIQPIYLFVDSLTF
jgi:hypothetical protein